MQILREGNELTVLRERAISISTTEVERSVALVIRGVRISTKAQHHLHQPLMAVLRGYHEGRVAMLVSFAHAETQVNHLFGFSNLQSVERSVTKSHSGRVCSLSR